MSVLSLNLRPFGLDVVENVQFRRHGFDFPILIADRADLDIKVPESRFSVRDVVKLVGGSRPVDVIEVRKRQY